MFFSSNLGNVPGKHHDLGVQRHLSSRNSDCGNMHMIVQNLKYSSNYIYAISGWEAKMIAAGTSATHTQAVLNNLIGYVATSQPCYVTLPHTINRMVLIVEVRSVMYLYIYICIFKLCIYI